MGLRGKIVYGECLGQRKVDEKSNEITAIPELFDVLSVEGCEVTIDAIDAMGCQTRIAEKIINQQTDYMLAVKGNQGTLAEDIADLFTGFEQARRQGVTHDYYKTANKDHAPENLAVLQHIALNLRLISSNMKIGSFQH